MNIKTLLIGALCLIGLVVSWSVSAYTLYSDPLHLQPYVSEPAKLIKAGMAQYQWQVEHEDAGKIVAVLDYKNYLLKVNVHHSAEKIWLEPVSAVNNGPCKRPPCKVDHDTIERWHLGLYRGIALAVTKEALRDASTKVHQ